MTLRMPISAVSPDLRAGLAPALTEPGVLQSVGGAVLRVESCLPASAPIPAYIRYADRDAILVVDLPSSPADLLHCVACRVSSLAGETAWISDLALAVLALDAVDTTFRDSGLWAGNIYLAGGRTLGSVLSLVEDRRALADGSAVLRELAALELAYLFGGREVP